MTTTDGTRWPGLGPISRRKRARCGDGRMTATGRTTAT